MIYERMIVYHILIFLFLQQYNICFIINENISINLKNGVKKYKNF